MTKERKGRPGIPGPVPMKVRVRGVLYESPKACAEAFGLDVSTIYSALAEGRENNIGLGRRRKHRKWANGIHPRAKPVTIGTKTYPSMKAASLALGYNHRRLGEIMRHPTPEAWENLMRRFMAVASKTERVAFKRLMKGQDEEIAA